ncbi:MAG: DUF6516 family protein [Burkholderiales bacterium]
MASGDKSLDSLLLLDGETFFADKNGKYWVKFVAKKVSLTPTRPHGLYYSLTMHDKEGRRILGFDNAHAIQEATGPGAQTRVAHDHRHIGKTVRFYSFRDAATLMTDFWKQVEMILKQEENEP